MRIPDSVIDAAQIDGASTLRILFKIVIPMSKNGIVLLTFMSFIDSYNTYEIPLVILKEEIKKPLSLIIRNVVENYPEQAFVPALLYMIPAILLFGMLRDNIINGITYNE